jgi:hypothetical protein
MGYLRRDILCCV